MQRAGHNTVRSPYCPALRDQNVTMVRLLRPGHHVFCLVFSGLLGHVVGLGLRCLGGSSSRFPSLRVNVGLFSATWRWRFGLMCFCSIPHQSVECAIRFWPDLRLEPCIAPAHRFTAAMSVRCYTSKIEQLSMSKRSHINVDRFLKCLIKMTPLTKSEFQERSRTTTWTRNVWRMALLSCRTKSGLLTQRRTQIMKWLQADGIYELMSVGGEVVMA